MRTRRRWTWWSYLWRGALIVLMIVSFAAIVISLFAAWYADDSAAGERIRGQAFWL